MKLPMKKKIFFFQSAIMHSKLCQDILYYINMLPLMPFFTKAITGKLHQSINSSNQQSTTNQLIGDVLPVTNKYPLDSYAIKINKLCIIYPLYYIKKKIDSMLPCVCDRSQRTSTEDVKMW